MSFKINMLRIASNNRLPYRIIRGSAIERQNKILMLNSTLFENLYKKSSHLDADSIKNSILENINQSLKLDKSTKIPIKISKLEANELERIHGGTCIEYDSCENILENYMLVLPLNKYNVLEKEDINTVIHEATHLHDYLLNPRFLARISTLTMTNSSIRNSLNNIQHALFYKNTIYLKEKNEFFDKATAKIKLKLFTRLQTKAERLNNLQLSRYRLISEILAYSECDKYDKKVAKAGNKIFKPGITKENACFDEKLKFLENEIEKLINQMRKNKK